MTWRGRETALPCRTIEEFRQYIRGLNFNAWRPSGMVLHNTASPTLHQWWTGGTTPEQRMINLRNYYENDMGWSAGPHAFCDGVTMWIFTDFNVKGVHSPRWNGTRLGIEMVGDYDQESDESGGGLKVMEQTVALFGECHEFFGWEPDNDRIKLHKEDPATNHDCPGRNVIKSEFIDDCNEYMGSGGDHADEPIAPRHGTVQGLAAGDTLNIRAGSSSSAAIIGQAENGDTLEIVGSVWNGSTQWLRVQFGDPEGSGIAVFGWVSSAYVKSNAPVPANQWRENITATEFGMAGDEQDSAYPDIDWIDESSRGVALPYKWKGARPGIEIEGPKGIVVTEVIDLGPWNTHDPSYVLNGFRPMSEQQFADRMPAQNGQIPSNDAGIDLTGPIAGAVGIDGLGKVRWRFAT